MRILVTVASRHGSTAEIGDLIAKILRQGGYEVDQLQPEKVSSVEPYGAIVVGSAVYMTSWLEEAVSFSKRFGKSLSNKPVWAFSVGLSGVPKGAVQDPSRIGPHLLELEPLDYVTFPGKIDTDELNLRERTIIRFGGGIEGDFRAWDQVENWAQTIIQSLSSDS